MTGESVSRTTYARGTAVWAGLFLWFVAAAAGGQEERPPNVILIMADDVGVEAFGCYGGQSYATPHIDALAAGGLRFENCHSLPLCTPSRVQLMTGLSNVRNYVRFAIMDPNARTFGHHLQAAGYRTAVFGKWQLHGAAQEGRHARTGLHPRRAGFDEQLLWQVERRQSRYWDPLLTSGGPSTVREGAYGPDLFRDALIDFMRRNRQRPFFAYYPMALVHSPFLSTPLTGRGDEANDPARFGENVAYMDRLVGQLVAAVDELGLAEQTLILFLADNGTHRSITSRRNGRKVAGGKGLTTDAGTHVPLVAYWPGRTPAGGVCRDLVDFTDFLPTLLDVAGIEEESAPTDGRSFYPQFLGRPGRPREWLFSYYRPRPERGEAVRYARDLRYKLYGDGRLFDLALDDQELTPTAPDSKPSEAAAARVRLQAALDSFPTRGRMIVE